jgi:hypothetical protein
MTRWAVQPVVFVLDLLLLVLAAAAVAIAITGGGVFTIAGTRISAHTADNSVAALLVVGLIRYAIAGAPGWFERRCDALVRGIHDGLAHLTSRRAWLLVLALSIVTLAVKLANAWGHAGFFSGDDVEVQEMSLAALFGASWPAWSLRSAFFPMVFVHPAHVLAGWMGAMDPATFVAAGRTAVAVLSTLTVPFVFVAGRRQHGLAVGVIGAFFVATSHLLVSFGGTELPRPVSAMLLAAAFALLLRPTLPSTILAALLVAVAAALRFSEAIFALPAAAMLLADRRWGRAALFVAVTAAAGVAIQAIADQTYWGTPFYSLRQAIDYTLVQRQSTRGFQPFWHYLTTIPEWTTFPIVAVAAFAAWRGAWRPALWAGVPIFVLSLLPHKEARYLLPIVPFVGLLAAIGLWQIVRVAAGPSGSPRRWAPMAITAGVFASTILSISGFHVQRSDAEVALARSLAVERNVSGVAVEQLWRWGGRIYLGHFPALVDLDGRLARPQDLATVAQDASVSIIALRTETCVRLECGESLRGAGFEERVSAESSAATYKVFAR